MYNVLFMGFGNLVVFYVCFFSHC